MDLQPKIRHLEEKKLAGHKLVMSLVDNKTGLLWKNFVPEIAGIENRVGTDRYSMQIYESHYFEKFDPAKTFTKYAAVEVTHFDGLPADIEKFILPQGLYAVWNYKGSSNDSRIFQYIFSTWLPGSDYVLDHRPHFEVLGEKYKNNDPDSEEEIWVPVKIKNT